MGTRGMVAVVVGLVALATRGESAPLPASLLPATEAFLHSLSPEGRAQAVLPFNSEERMNWHYVPKDRLGIPYRAMNEEQRGKAMAMLKAALSDSGYDTVETIRAMETVLREMEGSAHRDPDLYYFTVFGEPAETGVWGLRYEGHHVSLNWTIADGTVLGDTPQFLGANPAEVRQGPMAGTRALAAAEDLGRALVMSLSPEEREVAVLDPVAPPEILTGADREAAIQEDRGLVYSAMTDAQQGLLLSLIQEHASCQPKALAQARLDAIRDAGMETVKFAWMGSIEKGMGHYYRIQGPTFLIEYDNTQNDANHVHTVWRDFDGDFGRDLLKEHYGEE